MSEYMVGSRVVVRDLTVQDLKDAGLWIFALTAKVALLEPFSGDRVVLLGDCFSDGTININFEVNDLLTLNMINELQKLADRMNIVYESAGISATNNEEAIVIWLNNVRKKA